MPASETGRQKKQEGSVKMPARNEAQYDEDDSHLCSDSSGKGNRAEPKTIFTLLEFISPDL